MRIEVRSIKPIGLFIKMFLKQEGHELVNSNPDLRIIAYYDVILKEKDLNVPTINLHPGYLPYNRGVHTHIWPILDETPAGVSIHYVTPEVDKGDIIAQKKVKVEPTDTAGTLQEKIDHEMVQLFYKTWPKIKKGNAKARKQKGKGTYHWRREVTSFQEFDCETVKRLRACSFNDRGYAYFKYKGRKYRFGITFYET